MKFARPPDGFRIELSAAAKATLASASAGCPRLPEVWEAISLRMKMTAHREGEAVADGRQLFQNQGDPRFGIPTITVKYLVIGDVVRVEALLIRL